MFWFQKVTSPTSTPLPYTAFVLTVCIVGWLFVLSSGCSGNIVQEGRLATDLPGSTLQFQPEEAQASRSFLLYNQGPSSLLLQKLQLQGQPDSFQLTTSTPLPYMLDVGKSHGIQVFVSYKKPGQASKTTRVEAFVADQSTPSLSVALVAPQAIATPVLFCDDKEVQPTQPLEFGNIPLRKTHNKTCTLTNQGNVTYTLERILYVPEEGSPHAFKAILPTLPFAVQPGSKKSITLRYSGLQEPEQSVLQGSFHLDFKQAQTLLPRMQFKVQAGNGLPTCFQLRNKKVHLGSTHLGCRSDTKHLWVEPAQTSDPRCQKAAIQGIKTLGRDPQKLRFQSDQPMPYTFQSTKPLRISISNQASTLGSFINLLDIVTSLKGHTPLEVQVEGELTPGPRKKDLFRQMQKPKADVLWVIENSPTMSKWQRNMTEGLQVFMQWFVRLNLDTHLGVITTDVSGKSGKAGCLVGHTKNITNNTMNPIQTFLKNARVGTEGSSTVQALESLYLALQPSRTQKGGCNEGFFRKDAFLSIIFISATPEQSEKSVRQYIDALRAYKNHRNQDILRASVVTGPDPVGCQSDESNQAPANPRLWQFARELKGIQDSICNKNWAHTMSNGSGYYGYRSQFFLSQTPLSSTIQVKVNGTIIKNHNQDGWTLNSANNTINFTRSQIPPPGATIEVSYNTLCKPDKE